ncbi:MAG: glycosyltransferase family 39 protein [Solirubrobacteraceae bacterium]
MPVSVHSPERSSPAGSRAPSASAGAASAGEPFPLGRRARRKLPFERELRPTTAAAAVSALTLIGACLRVVSAPGLSIGELRTLGQLHLSLPGLISQLARTGVDPPLYPVLEWCSAQLFGTGDVAIRLPALLAGIAVVPAVAALARELFDRRTGVVAALLACVAPLLVAYSQNASGYELVALFGTLSLLGAVRAARRGRPRDWVLHAVAASAAVWSGWSAIFIVLAGELVLAVGVARARPAGRPIRPLLAGWALDTLALCCQLAGLGVLLAAQLHHHGGLAGVATVQSSGVSFYSTVSNVSWALFGFHPAVVTTALSAVWPLAMLASLVLVGRAIGIRGWLLVAAVAAPALGTLALGLVVPGAFDVRYGIAAVPPLLVLLAGAATTWPRGAGGRAMVAVAMAAVLAGALVDQQVDPANPRRFQYAPALVAVAHQASQRRGGLPAAVRYAPSSLRIVLDHYAPGLRATPLGHHLPTRAQAPRIAVIASFTSRPGVKALLDRELGALHATRHQLSHHVYDGIEVWWFA